MHSWSVSDGSQNVAMVVPVDVTRGDVLAEAAESCTVPVGASDALVMSVGSSAAHAQNLAMCGGVTDEHRAPG